jgi:predicted DNA-binding transcriptional regulator AlpA
LQIAVGVGQHGRAETANLMHAAFLEALRSLPAQVRSAPLARALRVGLSTVHAWTRKGLLPRPLRLGDRVVVYDRDAVIDAIRRRQEVSHAS